ncbi:PAS domain S-box protein [Puia sp.]|uniref:hybrid sensor histidine kinase/response regulator n=1 Tax=Puia sp. TaxID=2045100 RepID=UPI002F42C06C
MPLQSQFFESVLSLVPAEIIVADPEYRFLYVNASAIPDQQLREWMIGRTNEEFCQYSGRPVAMARARRMVFEKARRTRRVVEWAESAMDSEGVVQHFQHKVFPVFDESGNLQQVIIYAVRITETKEFEEKVRVSEKRYRDLFNHSQALICTHDLDGKLLSVNPAIRKVLGYEEAEMLDRCIQEFVPEKHRQKFEEEYLHAIRASVNVVSGEFCVLSKSGVEIYLLYKNVRMEEPGSEPYVIGFSQDITDRINMERELRITKKMTDDIARAKESFLAHMSHEIRTPMNGILGIASLLNKTRLDPQQRNYLQLIQESANNLLVIVNDILDLEKIVAGKLQLERIPFKIVDKIATTIQSFIYRAEEKELGLIFQNSIPGDLVVEGDPYRLSQVLNNLLSNALKFTNEGHINISTGIREHNEEQVVVEITIQDTGIGIGKEQLRTIFEPFEQADATISRKYGGTGLGLTISKNMVEMQYGELLVHSEEGKGSAFTIRVPYHLSVEAMQDNEISQEIDYKSLGHRKVLVAEDVELNQYLARHILESWDFEVVIVNNGREALEALEKSTFDCILMDVQMPEMDGIEATQRVRKLPDPVIANIPIIALTANALKGDSEKYLAAGMTDYLAKPFDEARLFRVISRNLTRLQDPVGSPASVAPAFTHNTNNSNMTPGNTRLYDLSMVQSVSGGDENFIKKMVALFIETVPQNMQDLKNALQAENWEQVGKTAHKLKSTIDSMGIKSIRQEIRTVEGNAREKVGLQEVAPLVATIDSVIKECIGQLQAEVMK